MRVKSGGNHYGHKNVKFGRLQDYICEPLLECIKCTCARLVAALRHPPPTQVCGPVKGSEHPWPAQECLPDPTELLKSSLQVSQVCTPEMIVFCCTTSMLSARSLVLGIDLWPTSRTTHCSVSVSALSERMSPRSSSRSDGYNPFLRSMAQAAVQT